MRVGEKSVGFKSIRVLVKLKTEGTKNGIQPQRTITLNHYFFFKANYYCFNESRLH